MYDATLCYSTTSAQQWRKSGKRKWQLKKAQVMMLVKKQSPTLQTLHIISDSAPQQHCRKRQDCLECAHSILVFEYLGSEAPGKQYVNEFDGQVTTAIHNKKRMHSSLVFSHVAERMTSLSNPLFRLEWYFSLRKWAQQSNKRPAKPYVFCLSIGEIVPCKDKWWDMKISSCPCCYLFWKHVFQNHT